MQQTQTTITTENTKTTPAEKKAKASTARPGTAKPKTRPTAAPKKRRTKTTRSADRSTERTDVYQQVTDKIVASVERGVLPWRKPWQSPEAAASGPMPVNALTGKTYQGVNVLLLWMAADERGFTADRWLTYRQAQEAGGQVRKGETGSLAVIYKPWERQVEDVNGKRLVKDSGEPLTETIPMLKSLTLFNVAQCDGLPEPVMGEQPVPVTPEEANSVSAPVMNRVLAMLSATGVKANQFRQGRAYYRSLSDEIVMPTAAQFFTESDYWSTLLHELVHATGHQKRLNREGITSADRKFGDPVYAFEELIAEMGSAFLCASLGVYGEVQHDSYVDGWLKVLKADKKALFRACRFSQEASEYLLNAASVAVTTIPLTTTATPETTGDRHDH